MFGNDDLQCDTYVLNVLAYVIPEGRYYGYFYNMANYAYNPYSTSVNMSAEYMLLSFANIDIHQQSQYLTNLQYYVPTFMASTSNW